MDTKTRPSESDVLLFMLCAVRIVESAETYTPEQYQAVDTLLDAGIAAQEAGDRDAESRAIYELARLLASFDE